jgi:UDP-N-acetylmuramoyl-L-alanyl-D-glutamate--2,6-diaminopimelate ligase
MHTSISYIQSLIQPTKVVAGTAVDITGIAINSKEVQAGFCFADWRSVTTQQSYVEHAIEMGAHAVITTSLPIYLHPHVTYWVVADLPKATAIVANHLFDSPSKKLQIVGVTGTNGKTTVATMLYKLFTAMGFTCGLIGTVHIKVGNTTVDATHTTPDVITLFKLLQRMHQQGCTHVFMECSSHAIHQQRIAGIQFSGAIFTNITHDHLDYHKTFDEYIRVKKMLFDGLSAAAFAISNADDKRGTIMLQNTAAKQVYYGLKNAADVKGKIIDNSLLGLQMMMNQVEVHLRLIGEFNAYNSLAVYAAALALQQPADKVLLALSSITGADGRFDYMLSKSGILAIVDYAHTPDALENVLVTIKKFKKGFENVYTVVGCGGDRDATKRPIMAQIACDYSEKAILTSDNPRTENPLAILQQMTANLSSSAKRRFVVVEDRKEAIYLAVEQAKKDDIILIAGKGHETYQEIMGVKYPFNDKEVVANAFNHFNK